MRVNVNLKNLNVDISIPASKSDGQRAIFAALLFSKYTRIFNLGNSNDELTALSIISQLGAKVKKNEHYIEVSFDAQILKTHNPEIDCKESGLTLRLISSIASLFRQELTITGSGSLLNRTHEPLHEIFKQLNTSVKSFENYKIPFSLKGCTSNSSDFFINGRLGSQYLSGLLYTLAYQNNSIKRIHVENLTSKPYIDMTLKTLSKFCIEISHVNYETFIVPITNKSRITIVEYVVESDWSSATFWIALALLKGKGRITGLKPNSLQADTKILDIIIGCGATYQFDKEDVLAILSSGAYNLNGFSIDITDAPDLFPILSILAIYCEGNSIIKGTHRLINKESNRLEQIVAIYIKLGVKYDLLDDEIEIYPFNNFPQDITFDSNNDHRIAMAAALCSFGIKGTTCIENADAVQKSYTNFWKEIGATT
jgi:3-phosphoshikimate 1-carboxyvinyltransferase